MAYDLGTAIGRIIIDGSAAEKGFNVATSAANVFYNAIQSKLNSIETLGENLTKVGTTGAIGLGVAVKAAATFEKGLSAVKAVSGATADEMELIRKAALRIGKDTSFSATEAASAMEELVKAGVSTKDVLNGAADATVALAAAGEIDLPKAAEIAASAMNNFALKGKDMPRIADLIAGAANASAIDVGDFGFSLSQAGASANLAGLDFEDLAVAIAEMGQAGIKGSDAGTSIKTFLTNLIPTTKDQKKLFRELGITIVNTGGDFSQLTKLGIKPASKSFEDVSNAIGAYIEKTGGAKQGTADNAKATQTLGAEMGLLRNSFFDAQGNIEDFATVQEILKKAMAGLTKEQQLSTLNTLFGSDALRASAVFAKEGAAGFNEMSTAMGNVSAAEVAATRLDNLSGSVEQLKGSFETMMIIIGDVFLPVVRKVVDGITSLVNVFNNLPEGVQKAIAIFIGVGSAGSLLAGIMIKLAFVMVPLIANFLGLAAARSIFSIFTVGFGALRSGVGVMGALSAMFVRAGAVFTRFAAIGRFLFGILSRFPALLAILRTAATLAFGPWGIALAAVVAGVILAYNKFQPFHDLVDKIANILKGVFLTALQGIKDAFAHVTNGFRTGSAAGEGFYKFLQNVGVAAAIVRDLALDVARTFMANVVPALKEAGGTVLQSLKSAWESLSKTFVEQILPALKELWTTLQTQLFPALQTLWVSLQPVLDVLGKIALVVGAVLVVALYLLAKVFVGVLLPAAISLFTLGLQVLINVIQFLIEVLIIVVGTAIKFAEGLIGAVRGAVLGAAQIIRGFVDIVKGVFNLIAGLVTGDWKRAWDAAKQIVSGFKDVVVGLIKGFNTIILNLIKGLVNGIINFFKGLYNTLVGNSIVPDMVNAIIKWIASMPGKAASALADLASKVIGKISEAMRGMTNGIKNGISNAIDLMRSLPSKIVSALGNTGNLLKNAGQWIVQGLIDGVTSWIGNLRSTFSNITNMIPDWKGPMSTDKKLLTDNGTAIMQSLLTSFEAQVPKIEDFLGGLTQLIGDSIPVPSNIVDIGREDAINAGLGGATQFTPSPAERMEGAVTSQRSPNWARDQAERQGLTGQPVVNNTMIVHNPVAEKSSVTWAREATRRAALGVIG